MSLFSSLFGGGASTDARARAREMVGAGALLLDVRSPGELAGGHNEGALNIPLDQLAARLGELDGSRGVVVYCRSGARSEMARGLLAQAGFQAHNLGPMSAW
jgi:rhodanese-related sulfurtransferase